MSIASSDTITLAVGLAEGKLDGRGAMRLTEYRAR